MFEIGNQSNVFILIHYTVCCGRFWRPRWWGWHCTREREPRPADLRKAPTG